MELSAFYTPLKRWWWLLVVSTALAAATSYWHVRQQPPLYEAKTTLMIGRGFQDPNPTGSELSLGEQLVATYADLAQRRPVREQTMAALGLTSLPEYHANPLPNGQVLELLVIDTDPQRAKAVADELANQLILQSPTAPKPEEQERRTFISDQLTRLQANIEQTQTDITAKQAELQSAIGALQINELQSQVTALQAKLSTMQSNYSSLLANTKDGAINTVRVIEPATLPVTPTASGQLQLILAAAAIAFSLAAGTAYALEYLDDTIRTAEDVARVSSLTSLPSIPQFPAKGGTGPVIAQVAPQAPVIDAFRALRTGLYAVTAGKPGKILLITSAAPREGKSLIAANLAAVLAQGDKSVLLIDADLRRPRQHELFDIPEARGLADLLVALQGHVWPNGNGDLIEGVLQKIEPLRLSLMVAGTDGVDAPGLLDSDAMRGLLATVAGHFDYVIIDSPALLAFADALMLSTQVDGVIVVAGVGSIPRKRLEQTLHRLKEVNANVIGVVPNRQRADGYAAYYNGKPHRN